jgi:hypothetical protein
LVDPAYFHRPSTKNRQTSTADRRAQPQKKKENISALYGSSTVGPEYLTHRVCFAYPPAFSSELYRQIFRSMYWVLPKPAETIGAMQRLILEAPLEMFRRPLDLNWVLGTSALFALVCYLATMIYFSRKDY